MNKRKTIIGLAIPMFLACASTAYANESEHPFDFGHEHPRVCESMSVPVNLAGIPNAEIYGELCMPLGRRPKTVQILVHSTWYNHKYFDPPQEEYSYVRSSVDAGYATFNIDRLGTGRSTKPESDLVTIDSVVEALHQVIVDLRDGSIGHRPFSNVVWVGSSFGSAYGWVNGDLHPTDIDAYVLTGILHYTKPSFVDSVFSRTISVCDDPVFKYEYAGLDCGYISNTIGSKGDLYYYKPFAAPGMLEGVDDFIIRDIVSFPLLQESVAKLGGILEFSPPVSYTPMPTATDPARGMVVPTLIVIGDHDNIFCGPPDGLDCTPEGILAFEQPYFTIVPDVYVAKNSGHATALHLSGPQTADVMNTWIDSKVDND